MVDNEKKLLLKDLCARVSYGVRADGYINAKNTNDGFNDIYPFISKELVCGVTDNKVCLQGTWVDIELVRPYLRPLGSMTESEELEHRKLMVNYEFAYFSTPESIDWLNAHHFDFRWLIDKGLALPAPNNMYVL